MKDLKFDVKAQGGGSVRAIPAGTRIYEGAARRLNLFMCNSKSLILKNDQFEPR